MNFVGPNSLVEIFTEYSYKHFIYYVFNTSLIHINTFAATIISLLLVVEIQEKQKKNECNLDGKLFAGVT